ncbi:MAG: hypothetical protein JNK02_14550 [Planctomycetes bacterium]|nr:hypothetical protein [Planctomycetota bacterium]
MFGHPALRLLFWLKLKGGLRLQARKLRRPAAWIFLLLGLGLVLGWVALLVFGRDVAPAPAASEALLRLGVDAGLAVLLLLTLFGAFQFRGLYLPKDEIELAFSAPIERAALVRYRLGTNLVRSLFAALLFGFLAARRMPVPAFGFAGTFLVMMTVPVVGQGTALLLGEGENRAGQLLRRAPLRLISGVLGALFGLTVVLLFFAEGFDVSGAVGGDDGFLAGLARNPWVRALLLPVAPWGRAITAASAAEFLPWFAAGVGAWIVLHELVVRARIDYRELSLATSAEVAKRIGQARRGGSPALRGAALGPTKTGGAPWFLGRGAFGAIAWLETTSMLRRARGTLLVSVLIVAFVVFMSRGLGGQLDSDEDVRQSLILGSVLISVLGTAYLCAGLKFDFRGRLEHMDLVRVWPLAPWKVFLATILPEVVFVAGLLSAAVLARAAWIGAFHPFVAAVVLFQPLVAFTWVALDNAVFLRAPVRYVPGQESALQNIGRSMVLMLLRGVVLLASMATGLLPGLLTWLGLEHVLGASRAAATAAGLAVAWLGVLAVDGALVWIGGRMLARFDVARDRGV